VLGVTELPPAFRVNRERYLETEDGYEWYECVSVSFLALILGPVGTVLAAHPDMPEVQTQNGIHYVTGGIGKEQSEALKMVAKWSPRTTI
jgi:hypothetical protein